MARPKSDNSVAGQIMKRVQDSPAGTVFYTGQFLDIDARTAVDKALSRLVREGTLQRAIRGLYYQPQHHKVLGDVPPSAEAVAKALAKRDRVRLQPYGGYAANLLQLSEQVPARVVFLTDGQPRQLKFGRQVIELRRASPRMMAAAGRATGMVIAGLRHIGKENMSFERVTHLRRLLSTEDRQQLMNDLLLAPAWMHPYFRFIANEQEKQ